MNEKVADYSGIKFASAAPNDSVILKLSALNDNDIMAMDRTDIDSKKFVQMTQNFPLKYLYEESTNTIKIQIWLTLIANLSLMVIQKGLTRK